MVTMPLVGGADRNGIASGDPTNLRFDRPYRASSTSLLGKTVSVGARGTGQAVFKFPEFVSARAATSLIMKYCTSVALGVWPKNRARILKRHASVHNRPVGTQLD
eukprot:6203399-Pleurochrysis_carterae.AAC.1